MTSQSAKRGIEETNIAINLLKQKSRAEAINHFNTALEQFEAIEDEHERKRRLSVFTSVLDMVGFPELSLIAVQEAIELDERHHDHLNLATDLVNYGNAQLHLGNTEEALSLYRRALDLCLKKRFFGDAASASTNIAGILYNRGQPAEAINMMYQSLNYLSQESFPETERITRITLAQALEQQGRSPEEIFSVVRPVAQFADKLKPIERKVLRDSLEQTTMRYLKNHPGTSVASVKRDYISELF